MATAYPTITGVYTGRSIEPRNIFASGTPQFLPSFASLDGSKSRDTANTDGVNMLRAGTVLGKITTGGKYRPTAIGITTGAISSGTVTTLTPLPAAVVTEMQRLLTLAGGNVVIKLIGPPTAAGTVATTSVTVTAVASSTSLTVSSVTIPAYAAGSIVAASDGSEAPSQFVTQPYGLDVIGLDGSALDHTVQLVTQADINTDFIVGYSSMDASVKTWLKTNIRSNNAGCAITFSDDR